MALKKRLSFDELVAENRKNILENRYFLERIEQNVEEKLHESYKNSISEQNN
ncbi:FbpB family small basic protein [Virgibacillus sp. W0430]|uniref:FbpB family small basic protein n=1 Tax=Virgibacillus sp. W0430 TaxID=3391580 RepID=UPI003F44BAC3